MVFLSSTHVLVLAVALWHVIVDAQGSIGFSFPPPSSAQTRTTFTVGQNVPFKWSSTFNSNTLQIWQGPNSQGKLAHVNLLTNVSNATTSYVWSAHQLQDFTSSDPLHLYIFDPDRPNCANCRANSSNFSVDDPRADAQAKQQKQLKLGLGLGLGFGIPLIIALTGIITWCCLRRRRQRSNAEPTHEKATASPQWRQPGPPSASGYTTASAGFMSPRSDQKTLSEAGGGDIHEMQSPPHVPLVEAPAQQHPVELDAEGLDKR